MTKISPSEEQEVIVDAVSRDESCKILAGAGTGKTSTIEFASMAHKKPSYCLMFTKSIAEQGKIRLGVTAPHVKVLTSHGLAYRDMAKEYGHRLQRGPWQFRKELRLRWLPRIMRTCLTKNESERIIFAIMDVISNFQQSGNYEISEIHLPDEFKDVKSLQDYIPEILGISTEVWNTMRDPQETLPISHDTYLKIWQLQKHQIKTDVIYYDEAQDANGVMLEILRQQKNAQIVLVGDPAQAIYGWRGAVNAMKMFPSFPEYPLTLSYRFGEDIAHMANIILRAKGSKHFLRGGGPPGKVVLSEGSPPTCILSRSNAGLVEATVVQMSAGRKVAILGGAEPVASMIDGAYDLFSKGSSEHPSFRLFGSWTDLQVASETSHGGSYRPFVKLVNKYGPGIPVLIDRLRKETVDEPLCDVVLSTVHKYKGRMSPIVALEADFPMFTSEGEDPVTKKKYYNFLEEEANVLYVAITRPQIELHIGAVYETIKESLKILKRHNDQNSSISVDPRKSDSVQIED